ncbi:MAG: LemA family protein [Cyanobacteria bacterium P01_A01_bin.114]
MVATFVGVAILLIIAIGVLTVMAVWNIYNRLITLRARYRNAYAQIDVQLQHRYDLIPNLVETAKGYLQHERETLVAVIEARNQAVTTMETASSAPGNPQAMQMMAAAEANLTSALGRLFAVSEAYPQLQANATIATVMEELRSIENELSLARQEFNNAVIAYNKQRGAFPNNVVASSFNFSPAEPWQDRVAEAAAAPRVSFN